MLVRGTSRIARHPLDGETFFGRLRPHDEGAGGRLIALDESCFPPSERCSIAYSLLLRILTQLHRWSIAQIFQFGSIWQHFLKLVPTPLMGWCEHSSRRRMLIR